jgi:hypothetical protein
LRRHHPVQAVIAVPVILRRRCRRDGADSTRKVSKG